MSSTVLLTGGMGFIGSHTAVCLLKAGYEVLIADNLSNSSADVLDGIETITGRRPEFVLCDCADPAATEELFRSHSFEAVIHFAGYKAVGESVSLPLEYYRNNLGSLMTTLAAMKKHGVKKMIFSSSATVYGAHLTPPFTEDMVTGGCTNPYGQTKFMAEQILTDICKADPELTVVLLRYFNPVGADESGLIGENPGGIPNNLMPYITQVAAGKLDHLNVFGNDYPTPDGTGVRDYIHITDLASGHLAALEYCAGRSGRFVFNLGTGIGYSVLDMVNTFARVNQVPVPYEIAPRRPGDLPLCLADPSLAARELKWKTEKTLDDMCRDSWRWQQTLNRKTRHE